MLADDAYALARAEADIRRARNKVAVSMNALEHEVKRSLDWREWVGRRPGLTLGLAFGVGFLLGRRKRS